MNCREINDRLITGACDQDLAQRLQLLELADPGLSMLSPLAKAAWRLHSDHNVSRDEAQKALASTFLIASSYSAEELLGGDNVTTAELEQVEHVISIEVTSPLATRAVSLLFESEGVIEHASAGEVAIALDKLDIAPGCIDGPTEQDLFDAFENEFRRERPACYPCDTDFIGMVTYRMKSVSDQPVSGPCMTDHSHQIEFSDLGLLQEEPNGREFCWLHQLTREQAGMLGLARASGRHHDLDLPEWLADDLSFSKLWISPDDLFKSYQQGTVNGYEVDSLLLCLGAGSEWYPGAIDTQVDEIDGDLDQISEFQATQLPIRAFSLSKGLSCDDSGLAHVLNLLGTLTGLYRRVEN